MNHKDLHIGATVTFPHWGKGRVSAFLDKDFFGYKVAKKYLVKWSDDMTRPSIVWHSASELRKKFNQKKAIIMAKLKGKS